MPSRLLFIAVFAAAIGATAIVLAVQGIEDEQVTSEALGGVAVGAMLAFSALWALVTEGSAGSFANRRGWKSVGSAVVIGLTCFPFRDGVLAGTVRGFTGKLGKARAATLSFVTTRNAGVSSTGYRVEMVWIDRALPRLEIVPEGLAGRVTAGGGGILDLESAEFNERFRIMADDARYAHAVLTPLMMERLLRDDARGLAIAIDRDRVVAWRPASHFSTRRIENRLEVIADIAALIPAHVVSAYGQEADASAFERGDRSVFASGRSDENATRKNWLATAAIVTIPLTPLSLAFAHASIRASQRGEADNVVTARMIAAYEWGFIAVIVGMMIGLFGGYALGLIDPTDFVR